MKEILRGQVALVTGVGTPQGLGAHMCRTLAKKGVSIFFTNWNENEVDNSHNWSPIFANELEGYGVSVSHQTYDLRDPTAPDQLWQAAIEAVGIPTILINNACVDIEVPIENLTSDVLDQHYAVQVRSPFLLMSHFIKSVTKGQIINLTSGQSLGSMGAAKLPYTSTKAALEISVSQLAPSLIKKHIHIYALDPGPVDTGWMNDDIRQRLIKASPRGRLTTPAEIGDLVVSILGEDRYISGTVIHASR